MLESPIQDPDISSTVPIPEVDITKIYFKLYFNNISKIVDAANAIHVKYLNDKLILFFSILGRNYYHRYGSDDFF